MKLPVYLVTGAAGFIGSNLTQTLAKNTTVIGIDNFYPNYDHSFKKKAVADLKKNRNFSFYEIDIRDRTSLQKLFKKYPIDTIFHLAALTGVRASLANPTLYTEVNAEGTKIMYEEAAKSGKVQRFISDNTTLDQEKALLDQNFIKDDSKKVGDYVKGYNVEITGFKRVTLG